MSEFPNRTASLNSSAQAARSPLVFPRIWGSGTSCKYTAGGIMGRAGGHGLLEQAVNNATRARAVSPSATLRIIGIYLL